MKLAKAALPTISAEHIAISVGLLNKERKYELEFDEEYEEQYERLLQFQQMSFTCDFDASLIAYFGVDLTDEQSTALQLIYDTTQPWIKGHVIGQLLAFMDKDGFNNKDAVAAASLILNALTEEGKIDPNVAAQFNVYLDNGQKLEEAS